MRYTEFEIQAFVYSKLKEMLPETFTVRGEYRVEMGEQRAILDIAILDRWTEKIVCAVEIKRTLRRGRQYKKTKQLVKYAGMVGDVYVVRGMEQAVDFVQKFEVLPYAVIHPSPKHRHIGSYHISLMEDK